MPEIMLMLPTISSIASFTSLKYSIPCSRMASFNSSEEMFNLLNVLKSKFPSKIKISGFSYMKSLNLGYSNINFFKIKLVINKTEAAAKPPHKLVLFPTIAFWTELLMSRINITSAVFSCDNSFLQKRHNAIIIKK